MLRTDFYVYVIFRLNGIPCYVGKGTGDRWLRHELRPQHNNKHFRHIIAQARSVGKELPKIKLRDNITEREAFEIERSFIAAIGRQHIGGPLVNQTDGGDGTSGRIISAENRANISKAKLGRVLTDEQKARRREAMNRPEVRARMSAAQRESYQNPLRRRGGGPGAPIEQLRRLASLKYRLGTKHTEATKQKIREKRALQAPFSEDALARMTASSRSRRHTEEAKQKIRAAWVLRRARAHQKEM